MSAPLSEIIEHLARHEGGAIGCSPVVIATPMREVITGSSVDDLLAHFRAMASLIDGPVTVTTGGGDVRLDRVLGYHLPTGRVVIEASEVTP